MKPTTIAAIAILLLAALNKKAIAQPNVLNGTAGLPFIINTDGGCNNLNTNFTSLNADMVEIYTSATSPTPMCVWTGGLDEYIWATGYTGVNNACTTSYSGMTVGISAFPWLQVNVPLPCTTGSMAGSIINDVDVAVGVYNYIYTGPTAYDPHYFALAVYESGGEIFVEHFNIEIDWAVPNYTVDIFTSTSFPFNLTNNAMQVSSSGGTARYPHISLIYGDNSYPAAGAVHEVIGYVITWHQGTFGNEEVWGIEAPISTVGQYTPFTTNTAFYIDNGKYPDVAGVTAANIFPATDPSLAYVAYLNQAGDEVHLSSWEYNTGTITNYGSISPTLGNNQYMYPRIAGPQYYDFTTPIANDPACVVTVNDLSGPFTVVNTYAYFTTGTPAITSVTDASDFGGNGFSGAGFSALRPVITGAGAMVSSLYGGSAAAYTDYPTAFSSDYTNQTSPFAFTNSGDIFAFGTEVMQTTTPSVTLDAGTNYWEVNGDEIQRGAPVPLSDIPQHAIATTHNSGYNMLAVYDGGNAIYGVLNNGGMPYAFKNGRPAGIPSVSKNGYSIYPNPVADKLNVQNADGASYTLFDITGRVISSGILYGNNATINTTAITAGTYFLDLSKNGQREKLKFIK